MREFSSLLAAHTGDTGDHANQTMVRLLLPAIVLVGAGLRLYRLDAQCLWHDELATFAKSAAMGSEGIAGLARVDHVAPLHYMITWAVTQIGGDSAFWLRLPSVLAGILTMPAFYLLGVRLFRWQRVGLMAAAVVAVSPFAIWYSQEARMYALLLLFSVLYVGLAWPIVDRNLRNWEWLALTVVTVFGLYSHHYMGLLAVAFGAFLMFRPGLRQSRVWLWMGAQVLALLAFVPWLILTAERLDADPGSAKPMILMWAPYTFYTFISGFSLGPSIRELRLDGPLSATLHHAGWIVAVGIAATVALVAAVRWAMKPATRSSAIWCLVWAGLPVLLAMAATLMSNVGFNVRYVIVSYPPIALLLAVAVTQAGRSVPVAVATLVLLVSTVWSLRGWYADPAYAKDDVRPLAAMLREQYQPDVVLIVGNSNVADGLRYYGLRLPSSTIVVKGRFGSRGSTLQHAVADASRVLTAPGLRVWFIEYRQWETDPRNIMRRAIESVAVLESTYAWPGVSLDVYHVPMQR